MGEISGDKVLLSVVNSLYTSCGDRSSEVQKCAISSLSQLSAANPQTVLLSACNFLNNKGTSSKQHQINILEVLEKSIDADQERKVTSALASKLVECAIFCMTGSKEMVPDLQEKASSVLVALSSNHLQSVWSELEHKLDPGAVPHYFTLKTLGTLALIHPQASCTKLKRIFGLLLPMFGMVKQDNVKYVFSTTVAEFCSAINEAVSGDDKSDLKSEIQPEVLSCFDVIFGVWMATKDPRVQLAVLEATSKMCFLLSSDKLEENIPKITQTIFNMLKKSKEQTTILTILGTFLEACVAQDSAGLDAIFEQVWSSLFVITCSLNESELAINKTFKEICKMFSTLNKKFDHKQLTTILARFDSKDENQKIFALVILRHLINFDSKQMSTGDKIGVIVSGLKSLLEDSSLRVKRSLAQTILAIALQDFLSTEGAYPLIEFILVHSASNSLNQKSGKKGKDDDLVSQMQNDLNMTCHNVLNKLFTNISSLESVLWPDAMQFLMSQKCHHALVNLCCNLVVLIEHRLENGELIFEDIDFEENVNLPKPIEMFTRLVIAASAPNVTPKCGTIYMKLLLLFNPFFEEEVQKLWTKVIPKMLPYLENQESEESFDQTGWEELLLKLFSKTLALWNDEDTFAEVTDALLTQLNMFYVAGNDDQYKYFSYKCLGLIMRQSQSKKLVDRIVAESLVTVDHLRQQQREGFAVGLGFGAATHLDQILEKLDFILKGKPLEEPKTEVQPQTKKRFGMSKSSSTTAKASTPKTVDDKLKATVMLTYGNVCFYAPINLITSRMEASILKSLNPHFASAKDLCLKQNVLRATQLLAKSMHEDHLKQKYVFNNRNDIVKSLQSIIQSESPTVLTTSTRQLGFVALAALVPLTPKLADADVLEIVSTCAQTIMSIPNENNTLDVKKVENLTDEDYSELLEKTLSSFNDLMTELAKLCVNFGELFKLFSHLESDLMSTVVIQKHRTLTASLSIFETFSEHCRVTEDDQTTGLGQILARLLPHCSDEDKQVRVLSLQCIQVLYRITTQLKFTDDDTKTSVWSVFDKVRDPIESSETAFSQLNDLSKVVSFMVDVQEVLQYTLTLFGGISNANQSHSAAACIALNGIFKHRSDQFNHNVPVLVGDFCSAMETVIDNEKLKHGLLKAYKVFGVAHLSPVVQELLLSQSIPYSLSTRELWCALCSVSTKVTSNVFRLFLDMLNTKQPFEEKNNTKVASRIVLAVTLVFEVLKNVENVREVAKEMFPELFIALLANIGSLLHAESLKPVASNASSGASKSTGSRFRRKKGKNDEKEVDVSGQTTAKIVPRENASIAIKSLLEMINDDDDFVVECEQFCEKLDQVDTVFEGVQKLADVVCEHLASYLEKIIPLAFNSLNGVYEDQRSCVAAFFGQLVFNKCGGKDIGLLDSVMNALLSKLIDNCYQVRKISLEAITNIANVGEDQVKKFSTPVLNALVMGLDDKDSRNDEITLVSLNGLHKVLDVIEEPSVRSVLITVCLRMKSCFERDNFEVRSAAFQLFGSLTKFCTDASKSTFIDQIHSILPTLLLHVNDENGSVCSACKKTLSQISPLLQTPKFQKFCEDAHNKNESQFHYGEFLNNVTKSLIAEIPEKLNYFVTSNVQFFKSVNPKLRANSALLVGFLLGNLPANMQQVVSIDHVLNSLVALLKDSDVNVRTYTAEALGLLSNLISSH